MKTKLNRSRAWLPRVLLPLLCILAGCSPPPMDQFKSISDTKRAALTTFLERKQSSLRDFTATVTEETNVDRRSERTHVGVIEFRYATSLPTGELKMVDVSGIAAKYEFSTSERAWVYKGLQVATGPGPGRELEAKPESLVTFAEVKAVFEK